LNTIPLSVLFGILIILIAMSAFFSGSETALMSLNRYRLRHLAKQGHRGALRTQKLLEQPDRLIGLILLGNNFVNILASAIATIIALRTLGEPGIAVATGLLTLTILIFAEVTPKTLATLRTERIAFFASSVYVPLMSITYPLVLSINWITHKLLELFRISPEVVDDEHLSSDEFRTVINEAGGLIPKRHREMLTNILDLGSVSVDDIMVPRNEIVALDLEDDWEKILHQIAQSPHSRLLIYRENIDNVVGFLYLRKMVDALRSGDMSREHLESVVRDAYFIPEGTKLTTQLLNFQQEKRRIGLVVDEYGDILGLLTLEEILEEIVGEFNHDPNTAPDEIRPQPDGTYIVEGTTPVRNLSRVFDWSLSPSGPKTLNGLILEHFENFPVQGSVFSFNNHPIEILKVEDNRVLQVRISPASDEGESEQEATGSDEH